MRAHGAIYADQRTVAPGSPEVFLCPNPGGASMVVDASVPAPATVELSCSPPDRVQAGTAIWFAWAAGAAPVTAKTSAHVAATITAVRVTATATPVSAAVCN